MDLGPKGGAADVPVSTRRVRLAWRCVAALSLMGVALHAWGVVRELSVGPPVLYGGEDPPEQLELYDDGFDPARAHGAPLDDEALDRGGYDDGSYDDGSYDDGSYDDGSYDDGSYDDARRLGADTPRSESGYAFDVEVAFDDPAPGDDATGGAPRPRDEGAAPWLDDESREEDRALVHDPAAPPIGAAANGTGPSPEDETVGPAASSEPIVIGGADGLGHASREAPSAERLRELIRERQGGPTADHRDLGATEDGAELAPEDGAQLDELVLDADALDDGVLDADALDDDDLALDPSAFELAYDDPYAAIEDEPDAPLPEIVVAWDVTLRADLLAVLLLLVGGLLTWLSRVERDARLAFAGPALVLASLVGVVAILVPPEWRMTDWARLLWTLDAVLASLFVVGLALVASSARRRAGAFLAAVVIAEIGLHTLSWITSSRGMAPAVGALITSARAVQWLVVALVAWRRAEPRATADDGTAEGPYRTAPGRPATRPIAGPARVVVRALAGWLAIGVAFGVGAKLGLFRLTHTQEGFVVLDLGLAVVLTLEWLRNRRTEAPASAWRLAAMLAWIAPVSEMGRRFVELARDPQYIGYIDGSVTTTDTATHVVVSVGLGGAAVATLVALCDLARHADRSSAPRRPDPAELVTVGLGVAALPWVLRFDLGREAAFIIGGLLIGLVLPGLLLFVRSARRVLDCLDAAGDVPGGATASGASPGTDDDDVDADEDLDGDDEDLDSDEDLDDDDEDLESGDDDLDTDGGRRGEPRA